MGFGEEPLITLTPSPTILRRVSMRTMSRLLLAQWGAMDVGALFLTASKWNRTRHSVNMSAYVGRTLHRGTDRWEVPTEERMRLSTVMRHLAKKEFCGFGVGARNCRSVKGMPARAASIGGEESLKWRC